MTTATVTNAAGAGFQQHSGAAMMITKSLSVAVGVLLAAILAACGGGGDSPEAPAASRVQAAALKYPQAWQTVANSATVVPGGDGRTFNSFNQPSVNGSGLVALRGRSRGAQGAGEPVRGIYARDMATLGALNVVFDTNTTVPQPNNTYYQDMLGTFTEFPAFPRIGLDSGTVVTRAQSRPVWTYMSPNGTETRVGTSGVYALQAGERTTAASQVGQAPGFDDFSVPGAPAGTRFDQFPGAPAVASAQVVVFKGNYAEGTSRTGIFFRDFGPTATSSATQVIASSDTLVPGQPEGGVRFGSTAPPSAVDGHAVFLGLDNEDSPTLGGIYRAPLATRPALQTLVSIGSQVPGESAGAVFTRLGEALSFDGQFVAFWGAWGTDVRALTLSCPTDGQQAVIAYCNAQHPNGFTTQVPVNQGFFVHDLESGATLAVARTGSRFHDFLYWTFSGRPPGVGDAESEDFEPPRWRASAFSAAFSDKKKDGQVVFKASRPGSTTVDGIYLGEINTRNNKTASAPVTVIETGMNGQLVDRAAPVNSTVTTVGIEREGLRNGWLAISAAMLDAATGQDWAGVYVARTRK